MNSDEVVAFQNVAAQCRADVSYYCDNDSYFFNGGGGHGGFLGFLPTASFSLMSSTTTAGGDRGGEHEDLASVIDSVFDKAVVEDFVKMSSMMSMPRSVGGTLYVIDDSSSDDQEEEEEPVSSRGEDNDVERGQNMLQMPDSGVVSVESQRRRRLSEVMTQREQRESFMPFGPCPRRNRCLEELYAKNLLSEQCQQAVRQLYCVRATRHAALVHNQQEQEYVMAVSPYLCAYTEIYISCLLLASSSFFF